MITEIAALVAGAGLPLALSKQRSHAFLTDKSARDVAFFVALGAGAASVITGSSTLGALALGSGGAWVVMKGDDVVRTLP